MSKTMKRIISVALVLLMLLTVVLATVGCSKKEKTYRYTYNTYVDQMGTNWNPHVHETNPDSTILGYLETPLATMTVKDSEAGVYQWIFVAAESVTDVTADNKGDLTKYNVTLPAGQTVDETVSGYVFEIKLRPEMKWENGTPINADTYIYSMQQLLNPQMKNYRANLYYSGESAVAGGHNYYYSLDDGFYSPYLSKYESLAAAVAAGDVYINVWDFGGAKGYTDANGNECPQYLSIKDTVVYGEAQEDPLSGAALYEAYAAYLEVGGGYEGYAAIYETNNNKGAGWDQVGCYKVDDYTIRYVCQAQMDYNYFLVSCSSNWLVYEELYEDLKEEKGGKVVTTYGTSKETTMSYGPYRMDSFQKDKQVVFVQNENYWEYTKNEDGTLSSMTFFDVDGEKQPQFITEKVVIDLMDNDTAKLAFLSGKLDDWTPPADEVVNYASSEQLYKVDEEYTYSFFFNTNVDTLKKLDAETDNDNTVVLSNDNFRKAMSLALDRADWVTNTAGYKPAYAILAPLYFYDIYNDPNSSYRSTEQAMQAIVDLYGVEYGTGKAYATLEEAYKSINGYNLTEAKALMKTACEELVAAGLYTAGQPIKIRVAWSGGPLGSSENAQVTAINEYLNAAIEGSGFGTFEIIGDGNLANRHAMIPAGTYAIGYGAWGGAAFYPFRNMQVYCDTEEYAGQINELGCWDPASEMLTIKINGEDVTKTWQAWSRASVGTGAYANASFDVKLDILSTMEKEFLGKYYRIPIATSTACSMLSYKTNNYTENYNIMYVFGGMRLMTYNYTNAEWDAYVASQNGTLNYT